MNRSVPVAIPSLKRRILVSTVATLLAVPKLLAVDAGLTSGAFTGDADSGVSSTKTYTAIANVIGGDVIVNNTTFFGSGSALSGAGWSVAGLNIPVASGGNHTTNFGSSNIDDLFSGMQYNGMPGVLTLSNLTIGQTYVATLYSEDWAWTAAGATDDRTNTFTTAEGISLTYNPDAVEASMLRYTFVATAATTTLNWRETRTGYTYHLYGLSNEQVFSNTWTPASGTDWNTAANWSSGVVPNTVGSNASFSAQAGATNVALGGATTVGHIEFKGTGSYTIAGASPLTLQADAGGMSVLKADAGASHTITAPIVLASDLGKFGAGTITLTAVVSGPKGVAVGSGKLIFGAANSYTGTTRVDSGATLDLNGTSQTLNTLNGAGTVTNNGSGNSAVTLAGGSFNGVLVDHVTGAGTMSVTKSTTGTLTLGGANTYSGTTVVSGGTLKLQAISNALLTDNFSALGTPDTNNLNFNLAARQTGTDAPQSWTRVNNAQVGNSTGVRQAVGTYGDYLLLANGHANLNGLALSTTSSPGPLKISFDMFKGQSANDNWTSFALHAAGGDGSPGKTTPGEFGFLYRGTTGIQVFSGSSTPIQDLATTSGGDSWGFYLADAAGTGSPFAGNGTRVIITQGGAVIGSHLLNGNMGTSFISFSSGGNVGGVDNLAVNPYQTNTLAPTTNVSLSTTGATLQLDAVNQTVASLNGVAGTAVNLGPFSRLTVNGSTNSDINGPINGTLASFVKAGTGTMFLHAASTYTGGTTISAGTVFGYNVAALGTGDVSIGNGANYLAWFNTGSPVISNNFTLNGMGGSTGDGFKDAIYADGGAGGYSTYLLKGTITLAANSNIGGHNINNLAISGKITGPGGLTKGACRNDENNTLILGNTANDYAGDTVVTNGILKLGASEVIPHGSGKGGVVVNAGATFDLNGNSETINRLSGTGTVTASPGVAIGAPIQFADDIGTNINSSKTYTHAVTFGQTAGVTINGVPFTGSTGSGTNFGLTGAINTAGGGTTFATGNISSLLTNLNFNGNTAVLTLSGLAAGTTYETHLYQRQWAVNSDRTQLFTFTAGSASGQLVFDEDAVAAASYLSFRYTADASGKATLSTTQVGNGTYHWYGFSNEVVVGAAAVPTLTVGDATDATFSGSITSGVALTKQGSGSQTLEAINSYTGATTINAGKLLINGSLSGTSSVTVNGGVLGGVGTINPAATVFVGFTGAIAPGVGLVGTLSTGPVYFDSESAFNVQIAATNGDKLAVTGAATLAGLVTLNLSLLQDPVDNTVFTIIDGTSPLVQIEGGHFAFGAGLTELGEGDHFVVTTDTFTQEFQISYAGSDVTLTAVPEPGSAVLLLLGATAMMGRRRRRP